MLGHSSPRHVVQLARGAIGCGLHAALLLAAAASLAHADTRPPGDHAYVLHARLDPEGHRVDGRVDIRWRNTSRQPVGALLFHLYPNAFAHASTVFMREDGAAIRGGRLKRRGGLDVTRLELADGTDLLPEADRALIAGDATQMRVTLPRAVHPGEGLELVVHFRVRLPSLFARMGASGDFFMIAQWFPKLARLEPDGRWASFPYHGLGEFYADFADYDLTVDVPPAYVIAAPGRLVERRKLASGLRRERYLLDDALDVAWSAYPAFRRVRMTAGAVQIDVYAPPGHGALARRQGALVAEGLARLGARLGPYPYPRIALVLPPREGHGAFGMEYPGLMIGAVAAWHTRINPGANVLHDLVTAHELAHQWFPMLVATDEVTAPWLDEGLAEWLGLDLIRERHGPRSLRARLIGVPFDVFLPVRAAYEAMPQAPSSLQPAHAYRPAELAAAVYLRPALVLENIRARWGERRLWSALGRYARAQRFAHPGGDDLLRAFDASYWPGFAAQVLVPALSARESSRAAQPVLATSDARPRQGASGAPLLSRLLLWAQTALGALGP
jgi:hypothetical protein